MATLLTSQLAQIRVKSTNPLDLKAQKKAHSQSLLFDPSIAATQDFETIYQICFEGFEDLCRLDARHVQFAQSLFSEQSKTEDRTQMTGAQNEQLDAVIECFLCLVGAKLLLKPALKAVEWLVRKFRVHEKNTQTFVLTFLPYHSAPIFAAVLSILPRSTPPILRFLQPYISILACPPRHAIAYSVSNNKPFLAALSAHVLRVCRSNAYCSALISFWASMTSEAVAAMCDQAGSARLEDRGQHQQDVLLFVLPIISEALSIQGIPALRIGSYMILTILASKTALDDGVLAVLMDAVVVKWAQSSHAGLICLAVLSDKMHKIDLPSRVVQALIEIEGLQEELLTLKKQYNIEKLVLGLSQSLIGRSQRKVETKELRLLQDLLESQLMGSTFANIAFEYVSNVTTSDDAVPGPENQTQRSLNEPVKFLAGSPKIGHYLRVFRQGSVEKWTIHHPGAPHTQQITTDSFEQSNTAACTHHSSIDEDLETLMAKIPSRTAHETSFLSHSESYIFGPLEDIFRKVSISHDTVQRFALMPVMRKSLAMSEPLFFSFYVKVWCGKNPPMSRAVAIRTICAYFKEEQLIADPQFLLPYVAYGLSDASDIVRKATAELVLLLHSYYATNDNPSPKILGQDDLYGSGEGSKGVTWLTKDEVRRLFELILIPGLEESLLDDCHVWHLLASGLNSAKHDNIPKEPRHELKTSSRLAIFTFFCSHAVCTPIYTVKICLLRLLNQIDKVSSTTRYRLLSSALSLATKGTTSAIDEALQREAIAPSDFYGCLVGVITPIDGESILALKSLLETPIKETSSVLHNAAHQHLKNIWLTINPDLQPMFTELLLRLGLFGDQNGYDGPQCSEALETLAALPLSSSILMSLLEGLPTFSTNTESETSSPKRRRMSGNQKPGLQTKLRSRIRHLTLVLKLIEGAEAEGRSELCKELFKVLSDLQHSRMQLESSLGHLQVLLLDCLQASVADIEKSPPLRIEASTIRADALIDCITTTSSPQARNAALLVVSTLATVVPELILHNVMPIFTSMGPTLLGQEDDFSLHVIQRTLDSIVPQLVRSLRRRKSDSLSAVSELLLSFVAAYEHIDPQRRLTIYTSLVDKLGPEPYLFAFIAILLDKFPKARGCARLAADIAGQYSVQIQLKTIHGFLELLLDAMKPQQTIWTQVLSSSTHLNRAGTARNLISHLPNMLATASLTANTRKELQRGRASRLVICELYEQILQQIYLLLQESDSTKGHKTPYLEALDTLLRLLPVTQLISAFESLLERSSGSIRRQVLRSFEHRMRTEEELQPALNSCLSFLPRLLVIVQEAKDPSLISIAISSMDRILEVFGKKDSEAVMTCARAVTSDKCLNAPDMTTRCASLLCLATAIEVAGDESVSLVPLALPSTIQQIERSMASDNENVVLHKAAYTLLQAVIEYVPWMITPSTLNRILSVSHKSANSNMGNECDSTRQRVLNLAGRRVDSSVCFGGLNDTWVSAMTEGPIAVEEHMRLLRSIIEQQPSKSVMKETEALGDLFLNAFDLRRIQLSPLTDESFEDFEIEKSEEIINAAAIAMVYRLNDASFRPFFIRAVNWASTALPTKNVQGKILRRTTWYNFLMQFFDTLKSIVTNYASLVIDDTVGILTDVRLDDEDAMTLWRKAVKVLHKTFEYDQDEFWQSPSHFTPISSVLVKQLSHADKVAMHSEVIPAIVSLAAVTDSATHHKELNGAILLHMRSDTAAVRLAAVQCECALTDRLGEEWLGLLAQMLPFISELLEDDDELIERETAKWVQSIERILGESLNPMLQ